MSLERAFIRKNKNPLYPTGIKYRASPSPTARGLSSYEPLGGKGKRRGFLQLLLLFGTCSEHFVPQQVTAKVLGHAPFAGWTEFRRWPQPVKLLLLRPILNPHQKEAKNSMIENLIFSLNSTLPVFLVIVVGWILKQRKMLTDGFCSAAEKFNFQITLPALLFRDISGIQIKEAFDLRYTLFCAIATTLCFFGAWGGARLFLRDKYSVGAFVQACYRGSAAVLGIAFIQNIYGSSGMAPMMIVSSVPLFNIYAVLVLVLENPENKGSGSAAMKRALVGICKNPIIWGILIGSLFSLFNLQLPVILNKTVGNLAAMATPLALIVVGAGFEGAKALNKVRPTLWIALVKLILQPLIFLPAAAAMGFTGDKMIAILVMLAAPTTPSCYIMAKNMNGDHLLTSSAVVATTLLSAFTLTFWIWALKSFGLL